MNEIELKNYNERKKKEKEFQDKLKEILDKHKEIKNESRKTFNKKYIEKKKKYKRDLDKKQELNLIKENFEKRKSILHKEVLKNFEIPEKKQKIILNTLQKRIINLLKLDDMIRRDLVDILGVARTTIFDNLDKLMMLKIVDKYTVNQGIRSRPLVFWSLNQTKLKELELIE